MKCLRLMSLLVLLAVLCSCGGSGSVADYGSGKQAFNASTATAESGGFRGEVYSYDTAVDAEYDDVAYEEAAAPASGAAMVRQVSMDTRKIIQTYDLGLQTTEFDSGTAAIEQITGRYEGFVQTSYIEGQSMYDSYGNRFASFTVRVPSARAEEFIAELGEQFNITHKQQSGEDITDSYYDTEARLSSLKIREERLLEMLGQAEELEYLLEVDRELSNVRYEIESLTSSLQRMDSYVEMSTFHINLQEVAELVPVEPIAVTFGDRISRAFSGSLTSFAEFLQSCVILAILMLPYLALIAVVLLAVLIPLLYRRKKKQAAKAARQPKSPADDKPGDDPASKD